MMRIFATLTEMAVLQPPDPSTGMNGWRMYRIEYDFEDNRPEGIIWAPPHVDPTELEDALNRALNLEGES